MAEVFISYRSGDDEFARELSHVLNTKGLDTWFDKEKLKPGEPWGQQIKNALSASDAVVLVWSSGAPSANVLVEAGAALSQGKRVIAVVADEKADTDLFPEWLQLQAVTEKEIDTAANTIIDVVERDKRAHR
jgi:hypothetical protein